MGVKKYVDSRPTLSKMKAASTVRCMAATRSTIAIHRRAELFANVRCMVSPMVVSMAAIYDASLRTGRAAVPGIDRS